MRTTKAQISCSLDNIIPLVSISEMSSFYLAAVVAQVVLSLNLVANPEGRFSRDEAHIKEQLGTNHTLPAKPSTM